MRSIHRWIAVIPIAAGGLLPACASIPEEESAGAGQARIESINGTDLVRVILTADAAERLDVRTARVRDAGKGGKGGDSELVIPHASVFYGPDGDTWTYTNPEPLTFERAPIAVDHIEGNLAFLSDGPPANTPVVTRGAAELFGIETGIDES